MEDEITKNGITYVRKKKLATVNLSDERHILLKDKNNKVLVATWCYNKRLNNKEFLLKTNFGHFDIMGNFKPFEMLIDGKWKRFNNRIIGRFLEE